MKPLLDFLRAAHGREYLAAKASDLRVFTRFALAITAVFVASTVCWDYAIDPGHAWQAARIRALECAIMLVWAAVSWRRIDSFAARAAALLAPLAIEASFIYILSILQQGPSYGMGGFLYFYIFVPFLMLAQPFGFCVLVLAVIGVFPMVAAPLGLSAGLHWPIYNAYVWMVFVPIVLMLLLVEYLYWSVFRYRKGMQAQALTDPLTQIANRRHFIAEGLRSLHLHQRNGTTASLLFVDIDHFKTINDNYGHAIGDAALKHVVRTLLRRLRSGDLLARYGGEEFLILLAETELATAHDIAERMRATVAKMPFRPAAPGVPVLRLAVSIGVAAYRPDQTQAPDIDHLIRDADQALYAAKHGGRDQVVVYRGQPETPASQGDSAASFPAPPAQGP